MVETAVIGQVTEAETAPESPVKEELESVVEELSISDTRNCSS